MRILHLGKYFPPFSGGIENFTSDLLTALAAGGVTTAALVHDHRFGHFRPLAPIFAETTEAGSRVHRIPTYGTVLFTPLSPSFPLALQFGISRFKPDILHLHMPNPWCFSALFLSSARRIPWIVHWHSDVVFPDSALAMKAAYQIYSAPEKQLLRRAAAVIATSSTYLQTSLPLSPVSHKTTVIPLGINPDRFYRPTASDLRWADAQWGDNTFRLLSIGRLTYYKGHSHLIDAMENVQDTRALIVGSGERSTFLAHRIQNRSLENRVCLTGHLPDPQLQALLTSCDALCLPSTERTEAFGLVLLEAMQLGKPVIVSQVHGSGMPWVVRDGIDGLHVQPGNALDLAAAINQLRYNRDEALRMGQNGKKRFDACFHISPVADQVHTLYRRVTTHDATGS
ncbi:MAG: glycosyl transferase family 1 [Deltaproteobacteria bacterium]|nr:MAG: glycosyl transferase family 1 [Deltaproteobacteria bacterium]